jgi:pilus assembly protein FimV
VDSHFVQVAGELEKNTMSRNLTRVWPLLVLALAGEVWALGLGDIRLSSALNEPLRAEIELLSVMPEELDNLDVVLASSETFERYGLDRPLFLQQLVFKVVPSGVVEGNVVTVTSQDPVTEPFITFLVETTWSRGRLLREYTMLLDPPTFAPPSDAGSATAVAAPRQSTQADSGRIERPSSSQTAPPPSRPAPSASFDTTGGGEYRVQRGETLWGITQRVRPDSRLTMNQTMLAIFEANPEAFAGNINIMRAGASLRIPSADDIFRINRSNALSEVRRQNAAWGGATPDARTQPSLVLVPPDDEQTGYDGGVRPTAAGAGDAATAERIRQLEQQIEDQDSLIEIRDDELAALRDELARLRGQEIPEPDMVADDLDATFADDDATIDTSLEPMVDDDAIMAGDDGEDIGVEDVDAVDDTEAEPATTTTPPRVVTATSRDEAGIVERVIEALSGFWGILIGGLFIVLGLLVWFARRAARGDEEESTGVWDALDADDLDGESLASTERLRALAREDDSAIIVVEQETAPARDKRAEPSTAETIEARSLPQEPAAAPEPFETAAEPEPFETAADPEPFETAAEPDPFEMAAAPEPMESAAESVSLDDSFSSETALNLDQSDPVAEADFHMAYGLYDQAADLINGALAVEHDREDLLSKLCEIYFVWGNRDAFVDAASRLRTALAGGTSAEWDKVIIMGQQIASDHEMFAGAAAGMAATRSVDLPLDGALEEDSDLDMDFAAGADDAAGDVIDLGEGAGDPLRDTMGISAALDVDTIESGPEETAQMPEVAGDEESDSTAEMPTAETDLGDGTAEMPTAETDLGDGTAEMPTAETDLGDGTAEMPTAETGLGDGTAEMPTAESALDDTDVTAERPLDDLEATAETPMDDTGATAESPTIEQQFKTLEETGELPSLASDEATKVASLDEETKPVDATAEIDLDDLGLDLEGIPEDTFASDMDDTTEHEALAVTGRNEELDVDEESGTGTYRGPEIDTSLLDATGQTQILSEDYTVDTAADIDDVISDQEKTFVAGLDDDDAIDSPSSDAETLLAPLDDDSDESTVLVDMEGDFDFAKTESLPKDAFEAMGEDLGDLTGAFGVIEDADTVEQLRDDETIDQPGPGPSDADDDARTMTEVGTKLDLARAYVDMGDPGGARSILEEVLNEGDDSQKQQAQQLLDALPE